MTTSSSTVVLADITSLCNVIASLSSLKTTEVADSVTTTTTTTGDNETQLTGKLETVQRLLLEVKQILRKYYVIVEEAMTAAGNPSVAATSNTSISHTFTPPTTLEAFQLLQIFEAQINEQIRATSEEGTTTKGTLFRYLLIAALSYAVVGIANLLNLASTVPTSSSTVPGTSSSSSVPESSQVQLSSQQESQIRLAIALTLRWAFFPTIERYFARADRVDRLFAVGRRLDAHHGMAGNFNNGHSSPTQENDSDIGEIFKLQPLYLVYISLLLMPTPGGPSVVLIPATIRDHSYALIIACYAIYRKFRLLTKRSSFSKTTPIIPETTKVSNSAASTTSESTFTFTEIEVSLRKALEAYLEESANQEYVVRELIGLIACAPNVFLKPLLVNILVRVWFVLGVLKYEN